MSAKTCFVSIDVEHDRGQGPARIATPARMTRVSVSGGQSVAGGERKFSGVENLEKILEILKKHGIPATLFVTGQVLEKYSGLVKEWSKDFEIACHSFSHRFWNTLGLPEREKELIDYFALYQKIFNVKPKGFRAPSHLIDQAGIKLLEDQGFLYDSSVVPHYPFFKKYRGFKGKAPLLPYQPSPDNYRQKGNMKILEIPIRGQVFGIPLAGAWIGPTPFWFYKTLFEIYCPDFLTINMHSWDKSEQFLKNLEKIFILLKSKNYQFLNGEQIFENRQ